MTSVSIREAEALPPAPEMGGCSCGEEPGSPHVRCAPVLNLLLTDLWWPYTSESLYGGAHFSV